MKKAKQTQYDAPGNLPLVEDMEPTFDATIPENFLRAVSKFGDDKFMGHRCGLSTNVKLI